MKDKAASKIKGTDTVTLQLTLTANEARIIRDELYLLLGDYDHGLTSDAWNYALVSDFDNWTADREHAAYVKALTPALEKLYIALRVSLNLSPKMPLLHGTFTSRYIEENIEVRELFEKFMNEKLHIFNLFFPHESISGGGEAMLRDLRETLFIKTKAENEILMFGVFDRHVNSHPTEGEIKWVKTVGELKKLIMERFDRELEAFQQMQKEKRSRKQNG